MEVKAGIFHNKEVLHKIWEEKMNARSKGHLEKLEKEEDKEKKRSMRVQALQLANACNLLLKSTNLRSEEDLPRSIIYILTEPGQKDWNFTLRRSFLA